jgi:hypothetical protein
MAHKLYKEILLLTKQQLSVAKSKSSRIIFQSDYGTGKTLLLKIQAEKLAILKRSKKPSGRMEKVFFVLFLEEQNLLTQDTKEWADLFWNIEVLHLKSGNKSSVYFM